MPFDLKMLMTKGQTFEEEHVMTLLYNLVNAVKQIHDAGLVHRDIKPANILMDRHCQVKIADYGLARSMPKKSSSKRSMSPHVVARAYRPPEVALIENYG